MAGDVTNSSLSIGEDDEKADPKGKGNKAWKAGMADGHSMFDGSASCSQRLMVMYVRVKYEKRHAIGVVRDGYVMGISGWGGEYIDIIAKKRRNCTD